MDLFNAILGAFGLAAAAGLNAYIPILLIGLAARFLPEGWIALSPSLQFMSSDWFLALTSILLLIEILADKIPVVDHVNDVIQTFIRPTAGAVLFAAATGHVTGIDTRLALVLGLLAAGSVHGAKSLFRPFVTATTGGTGNAVISFVEDAISLVTSLVALLMPLLILVVFGSILFFVLRWAGRRRRPKVERVV
jgi:hypothetical protein